MNGKLQNYLRGIGLDVGADKAYGRYNGFEMNAVMRTSFKVYISFYATGEQKVQIMEKLRSYKFSFFTPESTAYGLSFGLTDWTVGAMVKKLPTILNAVTEAITENGGLGGVCPVCGKELDQLTSRKCNIDGASVMLDEACVEDFNRAIEEENNEFKQMPNNYLKGFLGALIGGLVGAALTVAIYYAGFIASISGIVAVALGAFLYMKFKGKPNIMMVVIVSVTTFVCIMLALVCTYIITAGVEADKLGLGLSYIDAFKLVMENSEVSRAFWLDFAMTFVFTALGVGVQIFALRNKIRRKKKQVN